MTKGFTGGFACEHGGSGPGFNASYSGPTYDEPPIKGRGCPIRSIGTWTHVKIGDKFVLARIDLSTGEMLSGPDQETEKQPPKSAQPARAQL